MTNNPNQQMPPPPNGPGAMPPQGAPPMQNEGVSNEELIEAIIDEKWNDLEKDISTIIEWKNNAEKRLVSMEEKIKALKSDFDKLHESVLGKVGEYDKHITDVGAEISAMEKVFAKILPLFTEKVNQLAQISDDLAGSSSTSSEQSPHNNSSHHPSKTIDGDY